MPLNRTQYWVLCKCHKYIYLQLTILLVSSKYVKSSKYFTSKSSSRRRMYKLSLSLAVPIRGLSSSPGLKFSWLKMKAFPRFLWLMLYASASRSTGKKAKLGKSAAVPGLDNNMWFKRKITSNARTLTAWILRQLHQVRFHEYDCHYDWTGPSPSCFLNFCQQCIA